MFALVDGNCFFVSCERFLKPWLNKVPVVVLSNNDGCIISRSDEVKALGVPMGAPVFKWRSVLKANQVRLFSTNFSLYGDLSRRMMSILKQLSPAIEIYSIDEAFVDLEGFSPKNLEIFARETQEKINSWIGIPVGIGIAPTKSLAKVANKIAKDNKQSCIITNQEQASKALKYFPISDVWGIGKRLTQKLTKMQIHTACEFAAQPISWVEKYFSINELRIHSELRGNACFELKKPKSKKSICVSRSFGKKIKDQNQISQALAHFVARSTEKLRSEQSLTQKIQVCLQTNPFALNNKKWYFSAHRKISPTDDIRYLTEVAIELLKQLHQPQKEYKKVGVILLDLMDKESYFNLYQDRSKIENLMNALDKINAHYGRDTIKIAKQGFSKNRNWKMKQNYLSGHGLSLHNPAKLEFFFK